jgi:Zn-dependent M28 family amino/carboxypeptidase
MAATMVARGSVAPDGARWWSHVAALADDKLEGRDTGSAGHRKAAEYVAGEFARAGLQPAGTVGYLQPVKFRSKEIDEAHSSLALVGKGGEAPLTLGTDAIISLRVDPAPSVEAELVFVGFGLSNVEAGHDDFKGLDVRGKVAVYLSGAPASIPGPLAAHMQSSGERGELLRKLGAVGMVVIQNPRNMDIPWERSSLARFMPAMSLADPSMDDNRGLSIAVGVNPGRAETLFAGSGHTFAEILEAADSGKSLPHFAIPRRLKATVAVKRLDVESQNVAAVLPGNDPTLKGEYVVFSAHLDHIGIGRPINGDSIYNGAMDNAAGVAAMLDVAAILKESGAKLRRSVLFVAVTGEEKGLLGSRFFANFPTVEPSSIVADINTDMFLPLYPMKRLTVYGLDESDLGDDASAVAKSLDVLPEPDPEPKRNIFIRSDQYSFIRRGIPSIALKVGYAKGSSEEQIAKRWLTERYHAPSDDLNQPVDKPAAGAFDVLVAKLLERVANRSQKPRWKETSFFKRFGGASNPAGALEGPPAAKPSKRALFDGKSLEGWKKTESFRAGEVKVEDGSIVMEVGAPMSGVTSTRTDLPTTNYELSFEAKRLAGDDFFAAATFPVGKSFITLVNGGWGGSVTGLSCLNGADASENETRRFVKYQNGTWYRFRVRVTDEVIRSWVDDQETFAVNYQGSQVKTRLETRGSQPLGFATWKSGGALRAIEVRTLSAEEIAANNKVVDR